MAFYDINGRRINWSDRITKNFLFIMLMLAFIGRLFAPYWLPIPDDKQDSGLVETLKTLITAVIFYNIGRETTKAQEVKPPEL